MHALGLVGSPGPRTAGEARAGRRWIGIRVAGRHARHHRQVSWRPGGAHAAQIPSGSPPAWGRAFCGGAIQSGLAPAARIRIRGCPVRELRTVNCHAGGLRRNEPRGLASRSANDPQHADAIVLVGRRRLPIHAGFSACRPRMNVPALGIIHAGPDSLMRTGGEGGTQGPGSFAAAAADKGRRSAPLGNANGSTRTACPSDSAGHPHGCTPVKTRGSGR